jgi:hypothetical protein
MTSSIKIGGDALEFFDCVIRLFGSKSVTEFFNRQVEIIRDVFKYFTVKYGTLERLKNLPDLSTYPCDSNIDRILSLRHREISKRGVQQIKRDLVSSGINQIEILQIRQALELALRRLSLSPEEAILMMNRLEVAYINFNRDNGPISRTCQNEQESVAVYVFSHSAFNANDPRDIIISLLNNAVEILSFAIRSSVAYAISALSVVATISVLSHMLEYYAKELYPILQEWLDNSSVTNPINLLKDIYNLMSKNNIVNFPSIYNHRLSNMYVREIPFE